VSFISLGLNVFDKTDIDYNEMKNAYLVENDNAAADASIDWLAALLQSPVFQRLPAVNLQKVLRGVAIFAKACFGHPSPSKRQKLNVAPCLDGVQ
jgi:hypothetical protein